MFFIDQFSKLKCWKTIVFIGCEVGEYGADCKSCIGCQVCDITSGKCSTCKSFI